MSDLTKRLRSSATKAVHNEAASRIEELEGAIREWDEADSDCSLFASATVERLKKAEKRMRELLK